MLSGVLFFFDSYHHSRTTLKQGEPTMINKPLDDNSVTDVCIQIMDLLVPEDPNKPFLEENYDFEAQDEIKKIIKAWLRENNIPFEEK